MVGGGEVTGRGKVPGRGEVIGGREKCPEGQTQKFGPISLVAEAIRNT